MFPPTAEQIPLCFKRKENMKSLKRGSSNPSGRKFNNNFTSNSY